MRKLKSTYILKYPIEREKKKKRQKKYVGKYSLKNFQNLKIIKFFCDIQAENHNQAHHNKAAENQRQKENL